MAERPLVSSTVQRLPRYQAGRSLEEVRRELGLAEIIKLASNESAFGPSPKAVEAMCRATSELHRYPDDGLELRQELGARLGVTPSQLVLGAGATDLIELCVRTFATADGHAVVSAGSFLAYRLFLAGSGVPTTETPLKAFEIDLDAMVGATRPDTQLVFLPNPNNPTGSRFGAAALERFLAGLPSHVVLVLDDAYVAYHDAPDVPDVVGVVARRPRTVVLQSFSKAHGLAGARVGYAIASEELAECLSRVHRPFAVSRASLEGARAALHDDEHVAFTVESNKKGRARLCSCLVELGFSVLPSHTNFVTVRLADEGAVQRAAQGLLRQGVIVRPLAPFGMPAFLRISVGNEPEQQKLAAALSSLVREAPELPRFSNATEVGR